MPSDASQWVSWSARMLAAPHSVKKKVHIYILRVFARRWMDGNIINSPCTWVIAPMPVEINYHSQRSLISLCVVCKYMLLIDGICIHTHTHAFNIVCFAASSQVVCIYIHRAVSYLCMCSFSELIIPSLFIYAIKAWILQWLVFWTRIPLFDYYVIDRTRETW